jgi:hypothetical protein
VEERETLLRHPRSTISDLDRDRYAMQSPTKDDHDAPDCPRIGHSSP